MLKKIIYQSSWQMVFPVLRINFVAETLLAFMTFQGKYIPHFYMAVGLKSRRKKKNERGETSKEYRSWCLDLQAEIFSPSAQLSTQLLK